MRKIDMKTIIFIASSIFYREDGYKTRIMMEIEKLKKNNNIILFLPHYPKTDVIFPDNIIVEKYATDYGHKFHYIRNNLSFRKSLKKLLDNNKDGIVIGESLIPSIKSIGIVKARKLRFVFDCHGTEPDEYRMKYPGIRGNIFFTILKLFENKVVKNSDLLITVTEYQFELWNCKRKNHVVLPMMPSKQFYINPGINRVLVRKKLDILEEEEVYVYSGQNQKWQMCEETIDIFKKISLKRNNARLIILTNKEEYFKKLCQDKNIKNVIILSVPYKEMPQYLDACDYGFCIRNSSIVNKVASPTKVLEYVARNVKPILSEYVGDFSEVLPKKGLASIWHDSIDYLKEQPFKGIDYVLELNNEVDENYRNAISQL